MTKKVIFVLLLTGALTLSACQSKMVEQPRYDPLEASNFFADGMSVRQPVSDTVPMSATIDNPVLTTGLANGGGRTVDRASVR